MVEIREGCRRRRPLTDIVLRALALGSSAVASLATAADADVLAIADPTPGPAAPACAERAVSLAGDARTVAAIGDVLRARGIAVVDDRAPAPAACPPIHVRASAPPHLVLAIDRAPEAPVERAVDDPLTAATVIESFARRDLDGPLLATRAAPVRVAAVMPPALAPPRDELRAAPAPAPAARGVQLFAAAEGALASDRTAWAGVQLGACIGLGPVCAAVRGRVDGVAHAPSRFGDFDRNNKEVLVGLDIPIRLGRARFLPGFAAGIGAMHTHVEQSHLGGETAGLRADLHATLAVPITDTLALDVALSGDLTQATRVETNTTMQLPPEPRGIVHLALGIRYGGL